MAYSPARLARIKLQREAGRMIADANRSGDPRRKKLAKVYARMKVDQSMKIKGK